MMISSNLQATRYAQALLHVALKHNQAQEVESALQDYNTLFKHHPDLIDFFNHQAITQKEKQQVWNNIVSSAQAVPLCQRLLQLLWDHQQMTLLPEIALAYQSVYDTHRQYLRGTVTSAVTLSQKQQEQLEQKLAAYFNAYRVYLTSNIDPSVLGGVRIDLNGYVLDGTMKQKLSQLYETLIQRSSSDFMEVGK